MKEDEQFNSDFFQTKYATLKEFHLPLQRRVCYVASPFVLLAYGSTWLLDQNAHNGILLFFAVTLIVCWIFAIYKSKFLSLAASVYLFGLPVIALSSAELFLMRNTEITTVMGIVVVCIYFALYSKRHLKVAAGFLFGAVFLSEAYKGMVDANWIMLWPLKQAPPVERMITQLVFAVVLSWAIVKILKKSRTLTDNLFLTLEDHVKKQHDVIEAVGSIQPMLYSTAGRIKDITNNFVEQATKHATSLAQVNTSAESASDFAKSSAQSAKKVFDLSKELRVDANKGVSELRRIEQGFHSVSKTIENLKEHVGAFQDQVKNIEEILSNNREIGEHIKVLAVNASIEAASAGNYGLGFRVVAEELRELIASTEENFLRSGQLLSAIRSGADDSALAIKEGTRLLEDHYSRLVQTTELLGNISNRFTDTTAEVGKISESADQQGMGMYELSTSVLQIKNTANELEEASRILHTSMDEIVSSHEKLNQILAEK